MLRACPPSLAVWRGGITPPRFHGLNTPLNTPLWRPPPCSGCSCTLGPTRSGSCTALCRVIVLGFSLFSDCLCHVACLDALCCVGLRTKTSSLNSALRMSLSRCSTREPPRSPYRLSSRPVTAKLRRLAFSMPQLGPAPAPISCNETLYRNQALLTRDPPICQAQCYLGGPAHSAPLTSNTMSLALAVC